MYFRRFYDEQLAQASYLIGCQRTGEAIVLDPSRLVDQYLEVARAQGLSARAWMASWSDCGTCGRSCAV